MGGRDGVCGEDSPGIPEADHGKALEGESGGQDWLWGKEPGTVGVCGGDEERQDWLRAFMYQQGGEEEMSLSPCDVWGGGAKGAGMGGGRERSGCERGRETGSAWTGEEGGEDEEKSLAAWNGWGVDGEEEEISREACDVWGVEGKEGGGGFGGRGREDTWTGRGGREVKDGAMADGDGHSWGGAEGKGGSDGLGMSDGYGWDVGEGREEGEIAGARSTYGRRQIQTYSDCSGCGDGMWSGGLGGEAERGHGGVSDWAVGSQRGEEEKGMVGNAGDEGEQDIWMGGRGKGGDGSLWGGPGGGWKEGTLDREVRYGDLDRALPRGLFDRGSCRGLSDREKEGLRNDPEFFLCRGTDGLRRHLGLGWKLLLDRRMIGMRFDRERLDRAPRDSRRPGVGKVLKLSTRGREGSRSSQRLLGRRIEGLRTSGRYGRGLLVESRGGCRVGSRKRLDSVVIGQKWQGRMRTDRGYRRISKVREEGEKGEDSREGEGEGIGDDGATQDTSKEKAAAAFFKADGVKPWEVRMWAALRREMAGECGGKEKVEGSQGREDVGDVNVVGQTLRRGRGRARGRSNIAAEEGKGGMDTRVFAAFRREGRGSSDLLQKLQAVGIERSRSMTIPAIRTTRPGLLRGRAWGGRRRLMLEERREEVEFEVEATKPEYSGSVMIQRCLRRLSRRGRGRGGRGRMSEERGQQVAQDSRAVSPPRGLNPWDCGGRGGKKDKVDDDVVFCRDRSFRNGGEANDSLQWILARMDRKKLESGGGSRITSEGSSGEEEEKRRRAVYIAATDRDPPAASRTGRGWGLSEEDQLEADTVKPEWSESSIIERSLRRLPGRERREERREVEEACRGPLYTTHRRRKGDGRGQGTETGSPVSSHLSFSRSVHRSSIGDPHSCSSSLPEALTASASSGLHAYAHAHSSSPLTPSSTPSRPLPPTYLPTHTASESSHPPAPSTPTYRDAHINRLSASAASLSPSVPPISLHKRTDTSPLPSSPTSSAAPSESAPDTHSASRAAPSSCPSAAPPPLHDYSYAYHIPFPPSLPHSNTPFSSYLHTHIASPPSHLPARPTPTLTKTSTPPPSSKATLSSPPSSPSLSIPPSESRPDTPTAFPPSEPPAPAMPTSRGPKNHHLPGPQSPTLSTPPSPSYLHPHTVHEHTCTSPSPPLSTPPSPPRPDTYVSSPSTLSSTPPTPTSRHVSPPTPYLSPSTPPPSLYEQIYTPPLPSSPTFSAPPSEAPPDTDTASPPAPPPTIPMSTSWVLPTYHIPVPPSPTLSAPPPLSRSDIHAASSPTPTPPSSTFPPVAHFYTPDPSPRPPSPTPPPPASPAPPDTHSSSEDTPTPSIPTPRSPTFLHSQVTLSPPAPASSPSGPPSPLHEHAYAEYLSPLHSPTPSSPRLSTSPSESPQDTDIAPPSGPPPTPSTPTSWDSHTYDLPAPPSTTTLSIPHSQSRPETHTAILSTDSHTPSTLPSPAPHSVPIYSATVTSQAPPTPAYPAHTYTHDLLPPHPLSIPLLFPPYTPTHATNTSPPFPHTHIHFHAPSEPPPALISTSSPAVHSHPVIPLLFQPDTLRTSTHSLSRHIPTHALPAQRPSPTPPPPPLPFIPCHHTITIHARSSAPNKTTAHFSSIPLIFPPPDHTHSTYSLPPPTHTFTYADSEPPPPSASHPPTYVLAHPTRTSTHPAYPSWSPPSQPQTPDTLLHPVQATDTQTDPHRPLIRPPPADK